ncbi:MAG TPA: metallophosphoesterase family protein [Pirellulales bacterium]|nr:metallophosphoesterase family protein [Pirellulales bacterium]
MLANYTRTSPEYNSEQWDAMRIGIVSDTHGHTVNAMAAVRMLESLEVERVIHCGDVGGDEIVGLFARWPTHFVYGNVDDRRRLRSAIEAAGQHCHDAMGTLELSERRVAFLHGDDVPLLRQTIASGKYDLVCHGHTHVAKQFRQGPTLVLNPGALYRATPHSLALVELPSVEATIITV